MSALGMASTAGAGTGMSALAGLSPWLMLGTTVAGLIQSENDRIRSQKIRAAEMRAQPWTGNAPQTQLKGSNPWGILAQGATAGLDSAVKSQQAESDKQFRKDLLSSLGSQQQPQAMKTAAEASVVPMSPPPPPVAAMQPKPPMPELPRSNFWENPEMMRSDLPEFMRQSPQGIPMKPSLWQGLDPRLQSILSG
jgi:hypothetical protein